MKKLYIICVLILLCTGILAKHSDDFVIGDYSEVYYPEYFNLMKNASFNNLRVNTLSQNLVYNNTTYGAVIETLDNMNIDVSLGDKSPFSSYHSSHGSQYKFQAEYTKDNTGFQSSPSNYMWFYGIERDIIPNITLYPPSDPTSLKCSPRANNIDYYAWKDLKIRANMQYPYYPNGVGTYKLTGIMLTHPDINKYYFRFRFRSSGTISGDLFTAGLKISIKNGTNEDMDFDISNLLQSCDPTEYNSTTITYDIYDELPQDNNGYATVEFELDYDQLINSLPQGHTLSKYWDNKITYISPTLLYKNNGDLYIDYIEMEDDLHILLKAENSAIATNINNKFRDLKGITNLTFVEARDEPLPSQFDSFEFINNMAKTRNLNMLTAVNCYGMNYDNGNRYDLLKHFQIETGSNLIPPDFYLYGNQYADYNGDPTTADRHIQKIIDNMCNHYNRTKQSILNDNEKIFIPVVQTYGEWSEAGFWHGIMLPPDAQQKMLLYLPLCYGVDGIFTYKMLANTDLESINTDPALPIEDDGTSNGIRGDSDPKIATINFRSGVIDTLSQYSVIRENLAKVKTIGSITKGLKWEKASTLMTDDSIISLTASSIVIEANVEDPYNNNGNTLNYSGYVHYGAYTDDNQVYLMLVNRRTNKRVLGNPGYAVTQIDVNNAFTTASPQVVKLRIDNLPQNYKVYNYLTNREYTRVGNEYSITIQAGDGVFVKIGKYIPDIVAVNETLALSNESILHNIVNNGTITIENNVKFFDAKIINNANAQIVIDNSIVKSTGSSDYFIDNNGYVDIFNSQIRTDQNFMLCNYGSTLNLSDTDVISYNSAILYTKNNQINLTNSTIKTNSASINYVSLPNNYFSDVTLNINNCDFWGNNKQNKGIIFSSSAFTPNTSIKIINCSFNNYQVGVDYSSSQNSSDQIEDCEFFDNSKGINLLGDGSLQYIKGCLFKANEIGISLAYSGTKIDSCSFKRHGLAHNNQNQTPKAIRLENSYPFDSGRNNNITPAMIWQIRNCSFDSMRVAVEVINSSPRFINNSFTSKTGMRLLDSSFPDFSWNANNNFANSHIHFNLYPNTSIKLYSGHNNFMNPINYDFSYNKYNSNDPVNLLQSINCSYNYWDIPINGTYIKYSDGLGSFITLQYPDLTPNTVSPFIIEDQMDLAKSYQYNEEYENALNIYKTILINQIIEEKDYWFECVDESFNVTGYMKGDFSLLMEFYESLHDNPPLFLSAVELSNYKDMLLDYIKRCSLLIENKSTSNYDIAKSILQDRIDNSESEIDQILAGLNMDNILLLEEFENSQRKSTFNYEEQQTRINKLNLAKENKYDRLNQLLLADEPPTVVIPNKLSIQNYPNPFNPSTTLQFGLKQDSKVRINIYNIKGQKVKTLINENLSAGFHNVLWDGKDNAKTEVSSGVYFYNIETNHGSITRKMLMIK